MRTLIGLLKQIRTWDRTTKTALAIDLVLLILALIFVRTNPDLRTPALIGSAGLFIVLQIIVLWGNRNMVSIFTQAQRHYMAGEFEIVTALLRAEFDTLQSEGKTPSIDALVLLGNAYRNNGQLRESESILRIAVARRPDYHFAQYGLAKTRQAVGDYNQVIQYLAEAIKRGAPEIVRFDLAFTQYLRGDDESAQSALNSIPETDEVHRILMTTYLNHELNNGQPPKRDLIDAGLPFWMAEVERFGHMPYGRDVQVIVDRLQKLS